MQLPFGPIYTASFQTTALTTNPHDVFGLLAPAASRVMIHEIVLAQPTTEAPDRFSVQLLRGSTISSTSVAITPRHIHGWHSTATLAAGSSLTLPCTTLVSTASAVMLYADASVDNRWHYRPAPIDREIINVSQRFHVRITAPTTTRMNGTIKFSEIGRPAG